MSSWLNLWLSLVLLLLCISVGRPAHAGSVEVYHYRTVDGVEHHGVDPPESAAILGVVGTVEIAEGPKQTHVRAPSLLSLESMAGELRRSPKRAGAWSALTGLWMLLSVYAMPLVFRTPPVDLRRALFVVATVVAGAVLLVAIGAQVEEPIAETTSLLRDVIGEHWLTGLVWFFYAWVVAFAFERHCALSPFQAIAIGTLWAGVSVVVASTLWLFVLP